MVSGIHWGPWKGSYADKGILLDLDGVIFQHMGYIGTKDNYRPREPDPGMWFSSTPFTTKPPKVASPSCKCSGVSRDRKTIISPSGPSLEPL